jgi:hypothetical protein
MENSLSNKIRCLHTLFSRKAVLSKKLDNGQSPKKIMFVFLFHLPRPHGATAPGGPGPPHWRGFTITPGHTTFGKIPLDGWSAFRKNLYLTTPSTLQRHISMPAAGFETAIPASDRPQTAQPVLSASVPISFDQWLNNTDRTEGMQGSP